MTWIKPVAFLLCIILVSLVGCRGGGQIYNVKDAPVTTATGKEVTLDQVTKAIVEAGSGLGWTMTVVKPGQIIGTLRLRSHTAVVDIPYTTKTYSIIYKDSTNLKYDAEKQTIHKNYRSWIENLDNAIKSRISGLGV
ncbi:MAG: hypothetical protein NZM29_01175 [Nitrospira sp.]|nr:hypothetical protein [Nitrospira sp.]